MSLKADREIYSRPSIELAQNPQWGNYIRIWGEANFTLYMRNSFVVCASVVVLDLVVGSLAGYAFARMKFRGSGLLFSTLIGCLTIPALLVLVPLFNILKTLGMLNTLAAVIFPSVAIGVPFCVLMLRGFFVSLPSELGDAARVDGCTEFQLFWRIYLPLAAPALGALAAIEFVWTWNDFLLALAFLGSEEVRTFTLGLVYYVSYIGGTGIFNLRFVALNIAIIPQMVAFVLFQKYLVKGMIAGAVKG